MTWQGGGGRRGHCDVAEWRRLLLLLLLLLLRWRRHGRHCCGGSGGSGGGSGSSGNGNILRLTAVAWHVTTGCHM